MKQKPSKGKDLFLKIVVCCIAALLPLQTYAGKSKYSARANAEIDGVHYYLNAEDQTAFVSYTTYYDYPNSNNKTYSGDVVVPEKVIHEGVAYTVIAVGNLAFSGNGGLHSVTLPSTITHIGQEAFCRCNNLISVNIPDAVTVIERLAFEYCSSLEKIVLPASAQMEADRTFYGCSSLSSVTLPATLTSLGEHSFYGCSSLKTIELPSTITYMGYRAFENCGIESVVLPPLIKTIPRECFKDCAALRTIDLANVEEIQDYAFSGCESLKSLVVPKSVTKISNLYTFEGCSSLESISVDPNNSRYASPNNCNAILDGKTLLLGCKNTRIPNNVTIIGRGAFMDCNQLTFVTLPTGVNTINDEAFRGCTALMSCNFPSALTTIGWLAFYECSSLENIIIPRTTNSIDAGAFGGCTGVTRVEVNKSNTTYDSRDNCNAIIRTADNTMVFSCKNTSIPETATAMTSGAFDNLATKSYLYIPKAMVDISFSRFYTPSQIKTIVVDAENPKYDSRDNCNAIIETATNELLLGCANTTIPSTVTNIGGGAFAVCTGLTSITIPNSVTSIGGWAFEGCTGLTRIEIPSSVTEIEGWTFSGCTSLVDIVLPSTLTKMSEAFVGCTSLQTVSIPASVIDFSSAFNKCPNIKVIYSFNENPFSAASFVDTDIYATATLYVPKGKVDVYRQTWCWDQFVTILEFDAMTVEKMEASSQAKASMEAIYDVSGRFRTHPARGLNIIRMGDGTVRKVVIKQ